jgi:transcriptional regulator with XRE-family HTH domain
MVSEMTSMQVGAYVAERREQLKLSKREAAKRAGISPTAWGELEANIRTPSLSTQRGVATALGWPVDWMDRLTAGEPVVAEPSLLERLAAYYNQRGEIMELTPGSMEVLSEFRHFDPVQPVVKRLEAYWLENPVERPGGLITPLDVDDVRHRVERLERLVKRLFEQLDESFETDEEIEQLLDGLESERSARERAAQ